MTDGVVEPTKRALTIVLVPLLERDEIVPVAVRLARVRLPENMESPWTENLKAGEVVPMPTEPPVVAR